MRIRSYSEMCELPSFEERFEYLKLNGRVSSQTFGWDRIFNQQFYRSNEWKDVRDYVLVRDCGCDLSHPDHEIHGSRIIVHHMNPIDLNDIQEVSKFLLDPDFLVVRLITPTMQYIMETSRCSLGIRSKDLQTTLAPGNKDKGGMYG